jgi:hypothetical protein
MPFATPYGAPIAMDRAQAAIQAAVAEANKRGWALNITEAVIRSVKLIVQPDADYLARQSGAAPLEFVANTAADHVSVRGAPRVPGRKTSGNWECTKKIRCIAEPVIKIFGSEQPMFGGSPFEATSDHKAILGGRSRSTCRIIDTIRIVCGIINSRPRCASCRISHQRWRNEITEAAPNRRYPVQI